jgi:ferritin-like metal-binding protein YciE
MNTFNEAFEDLIKDMYNAEKQVLKALPKMAKNSTNPMLRQGFEKHQQQTEGQIQRLEQIAQMCGFKPAGKVCQAAKGLIEEVQEHLKESKPGPVMDAVLISGAQKFEHYEISGYGTARAWAELMGNQEVAQLIQQTLDEEEQTDEMLNQLAESKVNRDAFNAPPMSDGKAKSSSRSSTSKSNGKASTSASRRTTSSAGKTSSRSSGSKAKAGSSKSSKAA